MQRYLFPILFVVVLVTPFVLRWAVGAREDRRGVDRRLVVITPHNRDICLEFERAFDRWHREHYGQGVRIDYIVPGGTAEIVRLLETSYGQLKDAEGRLPPPEQVADRTQYHIVWGGGDYEFNFSMKQRIGCLQPIELDAELMREAFPRPDLAGVALYDTDPEGMHWVGTCLSSFGIVYSPFVYERISAKLGRTLPPPERWADLARPELFDMVALADPGASGSAGVAFMMVLQRAIADAEEEYLAAGGQIGDDGYQAALDAGWKQGMGDLLLIAANARYFTRSAMQVPADVSHANAAAGMAIDFYGRVEQELVGADRIVYISPHAATATTPDPIAVLHGTVGDDLELAKRFISFMLTPEGQRLWILKVGEPGGPTERALRRPPIREDVYADRTGWSDDVNPFEEAGDFNQRQEWMAEFTEMRMLWQAAWIESEAALERAWRAVLEVEDPRRREELTERLRDVPLRWQEVKDLRARLREYPTIERPAARAREQVDFARRFRQHYREVERAARGQ